MGKKKQETVKEQDTKAKASGNGASQAEETAPKPSDQALQIVDAAIGVVDGAVADYVEPAREKVVALLDEDRRPDEIEEIREALSEEWDKAGRRGSEVRERTQREVADRLRDAADRIAPMTQPVAHRMEPVRQRIEPFVKRVREIV